MSEDLPILDSCEGCGACCYTVSVPPFRIDSVCNEPEQRQVPAALIEEFLPRWEVRLFVEESPCLWFDTQSLRCRHYHLRPQACRDFEINSPSCIEVRHQFNHGKEPNSR